MACITAAELSRLHKAGISKGTSHAFVYRYPESDDMPPMDANEFSLSLKKNRVGKRQLALYMHIPFCTSLCGYCHYFKQLPAGDRQVENFLQAAKSEIGEYGALLGKGTIVNSVLFGGGTPTFLGEGQIGELALFLQAVFPAQRGSSTEATIESSPETLSMKKLASLRQNFNRISIGVQDFDDNVLRACNRNHGAKQALESIENARNAGFGNINIDLIYGLPKQGVEGWQRTLGIVEGMQPESVTASDLRVCKGTAFFAQEREKFASEGELIEMHSMFVEKMLSLGYEQVFPYQFARPGREMRFLQNQWQNNEFVGFGPSSCSYLDGWDYNNFFPTDRYIRAVGKNGIGCAVGKRLSLKEQMVRCVALGLKDSKRGVDKALFRQRFGKCLEEEFGKTTGLLEGLGLVESTESSLRLSAKGTLFYDSVSRKFFPGKKQA